MKDWSMRFMRRQGSNPKFETRKSETRINEERGNEEKGPRGWLRTEDLDAAGKGHKQREGTEDLPVQLVQLVQTGQSHTENPGKVQTALRRALARIDRA